MALKGQDVGKAVLEALGMQVDRCVSIEIRVAVNELVRVTAEYTADGDPYTIAEAFSGYMVERQPQHPSEGCRATLASGQFWKFCGETDMGQSLPALCTECGGTFKREDA